MKFRNLVLALTTAALLPAPAYADEESYFIDFASCNESVQIVASFERDLNQVPVAPQGTQGMSRGGDTDPLDAIDIVLRAQTPAVHASEPRNGISRNS